MKEGARTEIQEIDKERLIDILTEELPVLRAKIGLSQDDLSSIKYYRHLASNLFFNRNQKAKNVMEHIPVVDFGI